MNDYNAISEQLTKLISEKTKIKPEIVRPDLNFEDSGLDSFARIEFILHIEELFDIELSDSESAELATIDDMIKIIQQKTQVS